MSLIVEGLVAAEAAFSNAVAVHSDCAAFGSPAVVGRAAFLVRADDTVPPGVIRMSKPQRDAADVSVGDVVSPRAMRVPAAVLNTVSLDVASLEKGSALRISATYVLQALRKWAGLPLRAGQRFLLGPVERALDVTVLDLHMDGEDAAVLPPAGLRCHLRAGKGVVLELADCTGFVTIVDA